MSEKKKFRTEADEKRAATFRAYMQRAPPQNIGTVEWPEPKPHALAGMRICITGVLDTIEKDHMERIIKGSNGHLMSGPSKSLNYMVIGRDCGAKKLEFAQQNNIPQLDEEGFFKFITETLENATGEEPDDPDANDIKAQQKRAREEEKRKAKEEKAAAKSSPAKKANGKKAIKQENGEDDDQKSAKKPSKKTPKGDRKSKKASDDEDESGADDHPSPPKRGKSSGRPQRKAAARGAAKVKAELGSDDEDDESDDDEFVPEKKKKNLVDELDSD